MKIKEIRIEDSLDQIVTDRKYPLISIKLDADEPEESLFRFTIEVKEKEDVLWHYEGKNIDTLCHLRYHGKPLKPCQEYILNVSVWNEKNAEFYAEKKFQTGFMGQEWKARWITHPTFACTKKENPPAFVFYKEIKKEKAVKSTVLYVTALGVYTLQINKESIGDVMLAPGYTSYKNQMQYQTYDVTESFQKNDKIALEATVAGGWAVATFGPMGTGQHAGKKQALLLELHVKYEDGTCETVGTDQTWKVSTEGPIREASIYDGEIVGARKEVIEEKDFVGCKILEESPTRELFATYGELPRRMERKRPLSHHFGKKGTIFDFGQNFAGVIRIRLNGKAGQKVVIRHAEVLVDGELFTQPLRTAKAKIEYICKDGVQEYTPYYTYMGFRYVEVAGIEEENYELEADVLSSVTEVNGEFSCSNPDVSRLQENIKWGGFSNFVDIPTDCPQRDERLGWTGDIAVFAQTACFNFNMTRFLKKWLRDMRSEQGKRGGIPFVIPNEMAIAIASAGWGDACVMVPWALYMDSGDITVLKENYSMIRKYLGKVQKLAHFASFGDKRYIWSFGFSFGDWCAPNEKQSQWMKKKAWINTAYYANSCNIASQIASILKRPKEAERYRQLRSKIIRAYRNYFTDGNGNMKQEFQSAYVCPLYFGMTEGEEQKKYARNLNRLVQEAGNHLTTGFLGTPYILFALSDNGYVDEAYQLLLQDTCPSWLYEVKAGATTIWERWDALRPDGTVNLGEGNVKDISDQNMNLGGGMVSFNHYANGAVGDWLYRRTAGIEPVKAGYKEFKIQPLPGGGITWVKCKKETPYGTIMSNWKIEDGKFKLDVMVPFGTKAQVFLPDGQALLVSNGEYHYETAYKKA